MGRGIFYIFSLTIPLGLIAWFFYYASLNPIRVSEKFGLVEAFGHGFFFINNWVLSIFKERACYVLGNGLPYLIGFIIGLLAKMLALFLFQQYYQIIINKH